MAHVWALKHWHFGRDFSFGTRVRRQATVILGGDRTRRRRKYQHLFWLTSGRCVLTYLGQVRSGPSIRACAP